MDGLQPRPLSLHGLYLEDMRIICVGTMGYRWPTNHVNPFIHLPIHPSFIHSAGHHLLILLFIHLSISTSTHLLPSFCLPSSHFLLYYLSLYPPTHPFIHLFLFALIHTFIHPSSHFPFYISTCLSIHAPRLPMSGTVPGTGEPEFKEHACIYKCAMSACVLACVDG